MPHAKKFLKNFCQTVEKSAFQTLYFDGGKIFYKFLKVSTFGGCCGLYVRTALKWIHSQSIESHTQKIFL
jgi:hypothetical protein